MADTNRNQGNRPYRSNQNWNQNRGRFDRREDFNRNRENYGSFGNTGFRGDYNRGWQGQQSGMGYSSDSDYGRQDYGRRNYGREGYYGNVGYGGRGMEGRGSYMHDPNIENSGYGREWENYRTREMASRPGSMGYQGDYGNMGYQGGYGNMGNMSNRESDYNRGWQGQSAWGGASGSMYGRDYDRDYDEEMRGRYEGAHRGYRSDYAGGFGATGSTYVDESRNQEGRNRYLEMQEQRRRGDWDRGRDERNWWDRTRDEVSSWFGDEDAERRRRMDERREDMEDRMEDRRFGERMRTNYRGRGPRDYKRSEERIREDVCERLTDDSFIDASDIEVRNEGTEIVLTGTVHSREEKRRAEDLAESISGVTNVQNQLKIAEMGDTDMDTDRDMNRRRNRSSWL